MSLWSGSITVKGREGWVLPPFAMLVLPIKFVFPAVKRVLFGCSRRAFYCDDALTGNADSLGAVGNRKTNDFFVQLDLGLQYLF